MLELEHVQPAGRLRRRGDKCFQRQLYILHFNVAVQISSQHCRQCVHDIVQRFTAIGDRNIGHFKYTDLPGAFHDRNIAVFKNSGEPAVLTMFFKFSDFLHPC